PRSQRALGLPNSRQQNEGPERRFGARSSEVRSCERVALRRSGTAILDPGAATSGRSETLWPATKRMPPAFDRAFPRRSDARPASLRRWVVLPTDGYLGPPDPVFAKHDSGRRPPAPRSERLMSAPLIEQG